MAETLNIGLDLGSDTLKVAFAYNDARGVKYGKIAEKSIFTQVAVPALAYYDELEEKWYFGSEVSKMTRSSFITVVKIKSLISLMSIKPFDDDDIATINSAGDYNARRELRQSMETERKSIHEKNVDYYKNKNEFPKFYFPIRRKMLDNFDLMVESGQTFTAKGTTPQQVCEMFFKYVKKLIDARVDELKISAGQTFNGYKIAIVHPSSVGDDYLAELSRIVKGAFKTEPDKVLSSNKAVAIFAMHRKQVRNGDDFLVFDMGEEEISVVRVGILNNRIAVDGVEGHNPPYHMGGIDVDEAIVSYLESSIKDRETIGSPSAGMEGHIDEASVYSKQYLLMKDIKKAKVILSKPLAEDSIFGNGVPISLSRDLFIQRKLTKDDVRKSIGIEGEVAVTETEEVVGDDDDEVIIDDETPEVDKSTLSLVDKITNYILEETKRPLNRIVKKIFLSGGLAETCSLKDYIKNKIHDYNPRLKVFTFDDDVIDDNDFDIQSFEDSVFAPSVGAAIASLENVNIQMVTSFSYGTWGRDPIDNQKVLTIFVNRGTPIEESPFEKAFEISPEGVKSEEMFSTYITREDIISNKKKPKNSWRYSRNGNIVVGEPGSLEREKAGKDIGLAVVAGGDNGRILFRYKGDFVTVLAETMECKEGIMIDKQGKATPYIKNMMSKGTYVTIKYANGRSAKVLGSDIEFYLEGIDEFTASQG